MQANKNVKKVNVVREEKNAKIGVYVLDLGNRSIYIGSSKDIETRVKYHSLASTWLNHTGMSLYRTLTKALASGEAFLGCGVFPTNTIEEARDLEIKLQLAATAAGFKLLNERTGASPSLAERQHFKTTSKNNKRPRKNVMVNGFDPESGEMITFWSVGEAARKTGVSAPNISAICRGRLKSSKGWRFEYVAEAVSA
jgi:hypothetical protein